MTLTQLQNDPSFPKANFPPEGSLSRPTAKRQAMGMPYDMVKAIVLTLRIAWSVVEAKRYSTPTTPMMSPCSQSALTGPIQVGLILEK
jgi:hypothetical protein